MFNLFYLISGIGFLFSLAVRGWLKATYSRWSNVKNSLNAAGFTVARHILDENDLQNVRVTEQPGGLTDHYDPRRHVIRLSPKVYYEPSVASAAISAHEVGHALQDKKQYWPMKLRASLFPLAQLSAQYGPWLAIGGFFFDSTILLKIGAAMFAGSLLFQLLSLPLEFDASRRAKEHLERVGFTSEDDRQGAEKVVRAAAMTYVANSATAMGHLLVILYFGARYLVGGKTRVPR